MALAAVKTFVTGEVLYAADLNSLNTNILNNALSLISPLTGNLACGGYDITGIDELALNDATANASAAGRLRRNATNLTWHDGTAVRTIFSNNYATMAGNVGIIPAAVSGTPAQHGFFRENVLKAWASITVPAGTPQIDDQFNITGIADNAAGDFTVTLDRDFANATYCPTGTVENSGENYSVHSHTRTVGTWRYNVRDTANALTDRSHVIVLIGDQ